MNLNAEKKQIKEDIDDVNDAHLLRAIKEMLTYAKTANEERYIKPFTKQQVVKRALTSEKDIAVGRTTALKNLRKEVKKW